MEKLISKMKVDENGVEKTFNFKCDSCLVYTNDQKILDIHIKSKNHQKKVSQSGRKTFECILCCVTTSSESDFKIHIQGNQHKIRVKASNSQPFTKVNSMGVTVAAAQHAVKPETEKVEVVAPVTQPGSVLGANDPVMNQDLVSNTQTVLPDNSLMIIAPSPVSTQANSPVSIQTIKVTTTPTVSPSAMPSSIALVGDKKKFDIPVPGCKILQEEHGNLSVRGKPDPGGKEELTPCPVKNSEATASMSSSLLSHWRTLMKKPKPVPEKKTEPAEAKIVEPGVGESVRLCLFFAKNRKCYRKNCQSSHVLPRAEKESESFKPPPNPDTNKIPEKKKEPSPSQQNNQAPWEAKADEGSSTPTGFFGFGNKFTKICKNFFPKPTPSTTQTPKRANDINLSKTSFAIGDFFQSKDPLSKTSGHVSTSPEVPSQGLDVESGHLLPSLSEKLRKPTEESEFTGLPTKLGEEQLKVSEASDDLLKFPQSQATQPSSVLEDQEPVLNQDPDSNSCFTRTFLNNELAISPETVASESSAEWNTEILNCDICKDICKRAVLVPCCKIQACNGCAVLKIIGGRKCWKCTRPLRSKDLVIYEHLRIAVGTFRKNGKVNVTSLQTVLAQKQTFEGNESASNRKHLDSGEIMTEPFPFHKDIKIELTSVEEPKAAVTEELTNCSLGSTERSEISKIAESEGEHLKPFPQHHLIEDHLKTPDTVKRNKFASGWTQSTKKTPPGSSFLKVSGMSSRGISSLGEVSRIKKENAKSDKEYIKIAKEYMKMSGKVTVTPTRPNIVERNVCLKSPAVESSSADQMMSQGGRSCILQFTPNPLRTQEGNGQHMSPIAQSTPTDRRITVGGCMWVINQNSAPRDSDSSCLDKSGIPLRESSEESSSEQLYRFKNGYWERTRSGNGMSNAEGRSPSIQYERSRSPSRSPGLYHGKKNRSPSVQHERSRSPSLDRRKRCRSPSVHHRKSRSPKRPKTDQEWLWLAKTEFENPVCSDPVTNLTFHGYKRKKAHMMENGDSFNEFFTNPDIVRLKEVKYEKRQMFYIKEGKVLPMPGYIQKTKLGRANESVFSEDVPRETLDAERFKALIGKGFYQNFQNKSQTASCSSQKRNKKSLITHFKSGQDEAMQFLMFYNSEFDRSHVEKAVYLEKMYKSEFSFYYGMTQPLYCKTCQFTHSF